jgi:hypothetical protein
MHLISILTFSDDPFSKLVSDRLEYIAQQKQVRVINYEITETTIIVGGTVGEDDYAGVTTLLQFTDEVTQEEHFHNEDTGTDIYTFPLASSMAKVMLFK